jgi:hypothetical protein
MSLLLVVVVEEAPTAEVVAAVEVCAMTATWPLAPELWCR